MNVPEEWTAAADKAAYEVYRAIGGQDEPHGSEFLQSLSRGDHLNEQFLQHAYQHDGVEIIELNYTPTSHGLWQQGRGPDGEFYAVRNTSPLFCLSGETQEEADRQAGKAIESYLLIIRTLPN